MTIHDRQNDRVRLSSGWQDKAQDDSMKLSKTHIITAILTIVMIAMIVGCTTQQTVSPTTTATPAPAFKNITDMSGKTVTVPSNINRIVITCQGGAVQDVIIFAGANKIVGQPPATSFPLLMKMYPSLNNTTNPGSFNNINIETILQLQPDIVIASKTSTQGNQVIENAGIPVVTISTGSANISTLMTEFKMMGILFGNQSQSDALVSYWDNRLQMINDRLSNVSPNQRKHVYYMLGGFTHTNGGNWWGQDFITAAGGINVAQDVYGRDITYEQLLRWNPEVIIISENEGKFMTVDQVKNNTQISSLKAVKDGQLYECPIGAFWWDRPSPEAILGIEWLAKTLYPDRFADVDMVKETKGFYKTFYHYDLSDEEANAILNPQPPGNRVY